MLRFADISLYKVSLITALVCWWFDRFQIDRVLQPHISVGGTDLGFYVLYGAIFMLIWAAIYFIERNLGVPLVFQAMRSRQGCAYQYDLLVLFAAIVLTSVAFSLSTISPYLLGSAIMAAISALQSILYGQEQAVAPPPLIRSASAVIPSVDPQLTSLPLSAGVSSVDAGRGAAVGQSATPSRASDAPAAGAGVSSTPPVAISSPPLPSSFTFTDPAAPGIAIPNPGQLPVPPASTPSTLPVYNPYVTRPLPPETSPLSAAPAAGQQVPSNTSQLQQPDASAPTRKSGT